VPSCARCDEPVLCRRIKSDGEARPPLRAALVRRWAAALGPGQPWEPPLWIPVFLRAVAAEAGAALDLLVEMERRWRAARAAVAAGRRRTSRTPAAVDLLAAVPLVSATTLAAALGLSVKAAGAILDELVRRGAAVEVTHRHSRRLFGLAGLVPLREAAAPPRRPVPGRGRGRGRGRPRARPPETEAQPEAETVPPLPPAAPLARPAFDYGELAAAMQAVDAALRTARAGLARAAGSGGTDDNAAG